MRELSLADPNGRSGSAPSDTPSLSSEAMVVAGILGEKMQRCFEVLQNQIARDQSPWMSANSAARYADCSPSAIFKAASMGIITRYESFPGPRFKREDIDAAIEKGVLKSKG